MPIDPEDPRIWFLTGPTAGGKSAVSLELAERLRAEIISLDSMAVYRRLDIGTAKPAPAERQRVPHHLVDIIEPSESFSVAQYLAVAEFAVADILTRGRQVLFVGGTPLYLKALLRGLFEGPPADWEFRQRLEAEAASREESWLHAELSKVDTTAAAKLHPRDARRIIRALEVYEQTGVPISQLQQEFERQRDANRCRVFLLDWPREAIVERIDRRVAEMIAAGLVDEVRALLAEGVVFSRTAAKAVGYHEVLEHLAGARSLSETVALIEQSTRQFAKRQQTWFRSLAECRPLPMCEDFSPDVVAEAIVRLAAQTP
ncbi:MAG: tRNA (adenosine(37)-N6)-dimethylallyltransferase MiaA [Planctomycetes bacterium]|nr:tRNA (adenosine(37)-N6)-dimethylallyltransferase MiaA [Planctomycetota bacterium]